MQPLKPWSVRCLIPQYHNRIIVVSWPSTCTCAQIEVGCGQYSIQLLYNSYQLTRFTWRFSLWVLESTVCIIYLHLSRYRFGVALGANAAALYWLNVMTSGLNPLHTPRFQLFFTDVGDRLDSSNTTARARWWLLCAMTALMIRTAWSLSF